MNRIFQIARREFVSTALTRAFIIGAFVIPGCFLVAIPLILMLTMGAEAPKVVGTVAIIDRSGEATGRVTASLTPEAISARRPQAAAQMQEQAMEQAESGAQDRHQDRVEGLQPPPLGALEGRLDRHRVGVQRTGRVDRENQPDLLHECAEETPGRLAVAHQSEFVVHQRML